MAELKPGWRRVKFGEVVRLNRETCRDPEAEGIERVIGLEHLEPGDLRVRSWSDVAEGTTFTNRVRPGQVLFGKRRAYQRKVAVADFDAVCSGDIYVLESANPERLLPELLPFLCQTEAFFDHAVGTSAGSLSPRTNWSSLAEYEFALPPIEEQQRANEVLGGTSRLVDAIDAAACASRDQYCALASSFFAPGEAKVTTPSARSSRPWATSPLSDLTDPDAPICYGIVQVGAHDARGVPTLAIKNLAGGFANTHRTAAAIENRYARSRVRGGDIVVAIKATIGPVERVPLWFQGNISRDLARVRLNPTRILPEFFLHLWRSAPFARYIRSHTVGSTRAELSIAALRDLLVPAPDLEEQARVVDALESAATSTISLEQRLGMATRLHRACIHRALSGGGA